MTSIQLASYSESAQLPEKAPIGLKPITWTGPVGEPSAPGERVMGASEGNRETELDGHRARERDIVRETDIESKTEIELDRES